MSQHPQEVPDYSDGRTKQSFKDSTDINKILKRAQKTGTISHLLKHGASYGDFSDVPDLLEAHRRIERGQKIFDDLPSELRREFQDPFKFFAYVNDPANKERLKTLLPQLAAPGTQLPAVQRSAATEANPALASAPPEAPSASSEGAASASSST